MNIIVADVMHNNQKKFLTSMKLLKNSLENDKFVQFRKSFRTPFSKRSGGFPEQKKI